MSRCHCASSLSTTFRCCAKDVASLNIASLRAFEVACGQEGDIGMHVELPPLFLLFLFLLAQADCEPPQRVGVLLVFYLEVLFH